MTQADVLHLWETGRSLHPLDQGVLAIATAFPEVEESVADWPLGRRNRALAEMRSAAFGGALRGWTACKTCGEKMEFELDGRVLAQMSDGTDCVELEGERYRLPTSRDLAAVVKEKDATVAARRLLRQCSLDGTRDVWSDEEMEAVGELMAAADPLSEILLSFDCPGCGAAFEESLDLPTFLWAEMEARAKHLLSEVHALASAYGWCEGEILSLSVARRSFYLDMVRS